MRKQRWLLLGIFLLVGAGQAAGQESYALTGQVVDAEGKPMLGANVLLSPGNRGSSTDFQGRFVFKPLSAGKYILKVSYVGFKTICDTLQISRDLTFRAVLQPLPTSLQEVVVSDDQVAARKKDEPLNIEVVDEDFIRQNLGGSLMNSLERLPGVSTLQIGSGQSKPVIRGLGFNRVLVVDNNLKHESQQWGADHGLEIDQFAVGNAEVVKGPAALMYGSDAIGGVIKLNNREMLATDGFGGCIDLTGKTNNDFIGTSLSIYGRKGRFYADFRGTLSEYADYRVPTDSIEIYSYRADIDRNYLRNTAGNEQNLHLSLGYIHDIFQNRLIVSNVNHKSGFFANAHGLEPINVDRNLHDHSNRDIQFPYQAYNHFKIVNNLKYIPRNGKMTIDFDLGFQNNFRQENSIYVDHGNMPAIFPDTLPFPETLEREFDKNVILTSAKVHILIDEKNSIHLGANGEYHENDIDGRGFIIPAYEQLNVGVFAYVNRDFSEQSVLQIGIRYDVGHVQTEAYNDWFPSPIETDQGMAEVYLPRSEALNRIFSNISWSIGYNYHPSEWIYKVNIGKSFRMPIPKELAANGINYHRFSYEVGNPDLDPEVAYQADLGVEYAADRLAFGISPFLNYFSNYLYLNPTAAYNREYGAGNQVFNYTQSQVIRYGGEFHLHYQFLKVFRIGLMGEYVYQYQLSGDKKGFTLPFSPPFSSIINLKYQGKKIRSFEKPYFSIDYRLVSRQNRIVPPEEVTPGYGMINLQLGSEIKINDQKLIVSFQVQNLLNDQFFNHTSFYRLINVPEPGRNFVLNLTFPFLIT